MKLYKDYDINNICDLAEINHILWAGAKTRWEDMNSGEQLYLLQLFEEFYPEGASWTEFNDFIWFDSDDLLEQRRLMMEN